jgi:hypothetical protein
MAPHASTTTRGAYEQRAGVHARREASKLQVFHKIGHEKHKKRLDDSVQAMHRWRVRKDTSTGNWVTVHIADEVSGWLPVLWHITIEG